MKIEKTLTLIKPGNFLYCLEIFECLNDLLKKDFTRNVPVHIDPVPELIIREHYQEIDKLPIYEPTVKAFVESKDGIVLRVYGGPNIVSRMRKVIGHTDPQKAEKETIRQIFSNDSMEQAWADLRYLNNVLHASSSVEDATREIKLWKDFLYGKWTC